jgi:hypothetical protein
VFEKNKARALSPSPIGFVGSGSQIIRRSRNNKHKQKQINKH